MSTRASTTGFIPEQVQYLRSPIWRGAVRQDPKVAMGNPYISGEYILGQLNRAFGFDGWSVEILSMAEENVDQVNGKYKATFSCRVELTVFAGSRIIKRHGVGAHAMTSRNLVDVVANGQASAYTKAIKNAAITFGSQFGLNTVRGGRGWQNNTVQNHPVPPDLGISLSTAQLEQTAAAEAGAGSEERSELNPVQQAAAAKPSSYPLHNLVKDEEAGGPSEEKLNAILTKLNADLDLSAAREEKTAYIRKAVVSNTAETRRVIDEVML